MRNRTEQIRDAELARLLTRVPQLSPLARAAVATCIDRVVDTLLQPALTRVTVRSESTDTSHRAETLSMLFALEPDSAGRCRR
ncbi:hypothetical protein GCM10009733_091000 [Nonomuraea maheshkhaliensis]|uniref:Tetrapyrrole biosynthesis glutamyl-tRNA reductase dimerisation domain-containing protein n=2 Tax=Nonomuraea maheshkhaliensis TaxID=419590 RepID=A0ABP4T000_9ACTN